MTDTPTEEPEGETILDRPIVREMKESYLTYALSVIHSRALPDVRDGLKPSQRRILVAMNDLNLTPGSSTSKCAGIVGETMKRYHPHGDGAIYPTLVRMAQEWNTRHTLVHKQGNFGSIAGLPPAAMRYTEARMSAISAMMMDDIKLDTVVPSGVGETGNLARRACYRGGVGEQRAVVELVVVVVRRFRAPDDRENTNVLRVCGADKVVVPESVMPAYGAVQRYTELPTKLAAVHYGGYCREI